MNDEEIVEYFNRLLENAPGWLDGDADQLDLAERYVAYLEGCLSNLTGLPPARFPVEGWN